MFLVSCAPELLCPVLLAYIVCFKHAGVEFKAKWHVGDTPMDIQAAQGGHAKALGVLTGVYSRQDLEGCGAGDLAFRQGRHSESCCCLHHSEEATPMQVALFIVMLSEIHQSLCKPPVLCSEVVL